MPKNKSGTTKKRQRTAKAPLAGSQKNTIKLAPLRAALLVGFTDPEGEFRPFPKNSKVKVIYGKNLKTDERTIDNDEGKLIFRFHRKDAVKYEFFRLEFVAEKDNYIICEKRGEAPKTVELGSYGAAKKKAKTGKRFFRLPASWSLLTSKWTIEADDKIYDKARKAKKFLLTDGGTPRGTGTRSKPIKTVLDPHWQYVKFEFFDRFYGHTDHANKPISIPAILLEGSGEAKSSPDTRSNWTIVQGGDEKKSIQCLPWIIQAKPSGTPSPKPNRKSGLRFKQPEDSYVVSKSATEREIKDAKSFTTADTDSLKPSANRLKYYDLPELWKSQKYWCRLSDNKDEQNFFEKMAKQKTKADKPLIFSLDDIVLTDDKYAPLSVRDTDRIVVFYHEFLDAVGAAGKKGDGGRPGATYLKNGLYKPGPDLVEAKKIASDEAKAAEKTKLEKEGRETAVAAQTKTEEDNARAAAKAQATTAAKTADEVEAAGDKAVTDVAGDAAAQQRIKDAGDNAVTAVSTDPTAQTKIDTAGSDAAANTDAPLAAKRQAEAKQLTIEEKNARDAAVVTQTNTEKADARRIAEAKKKKEEEDAVRIPAEAKARKSLSSKFKPALITKAGDNAVAALLADATLQARITAAGDQAVADVAVDNAAQARIKAAGDTAVANIGTNAPAQTRKTAAGKAAENAAKVFPYSDITRHKEVPNYITDYPHWSRLVVVNGNLFDVFRKRTKTGDVIGARAAVRWVDATDSGVGVPPATELTLFPAIEPTTAVNQAVASLISQPYYRQSFFAKSPERPAGFYDEWNSPVANTDTVIYPVGRNSVALLRTNSYHNTNEENVLFLYHPLSFDFTAEESLLNPTGTLPADIEEQRIKWTTAVIKNCADRWNGNDALNNSRAWVIEDKAAEPKLRSQVVTFYQNVDIPKAHIHIRTIVESGTSSMNSFVGTGKLRVEAGKDTPGRGFAAAHEMGHVGGQPDEYTPKVKGYPAFISNHVAGAPFILDQNAMMNGNRQVRARSFWHLTEWLRQLDPLKNTKFQIEHGVYTYKIPHYNHPDRPGRNYTNFPVKSKIFHASAVTYFDSFLYFLGHDEYSRVVLTSQPDGIMVVVVKLLLEFTGYTNEEAIIKEVFKKINQRVNTALNNTRVHAQFSLTGINRGTANTFEKCLLHFSPRFEIVDATVAESPAHLRIKIKTPVAVAEPAAAVLPTAAASPKDYKYRVGAVESAQMDLPELYAAISAGTIKPDTDVHDGTNWKTANDYPDLKTLFDVYYWYDSGGFQGPKTLKELYELAKAGTINCNTDTKGPGWVAAKKADQIPELLPVLKRWFYTGNISPQTEREIHGKFPAGTIKDDTVIKRKPDDTSKEAKDWDEFEAKFTGNIAPRTLDFRFPQNPGTVPELNPVIAHLESAVFRDFCELLGLSVKSTDTNYYGNADAYKDIVRACVNDTALNPTMSRP